MNSKHKTFEGIFNDVLGWNDRLWYNFDNLIPSSSHLKVDVQEKDGKIKYFIDLPGVSKEQVSILQEGPYVMVDAERSDRNVVSKFSTKFSISTKAKIETLEALMENGVLTISFDLKSDKEIYPVPKRIEIKSS